MSGKQSMDYESKEIYKALLESAHRQGYDTFAVVFINQYEHKIVKPAQLPALEQMNLNDVIEQI